MYLFLMNGFEEGRFIELNSGTTQIGRSEGDELDGKKNDVILAHDNKISRVHTCFINNEEVLVKDLGSTHGTFLNQTKIDVGTDKRIEAGDVITMGETLLLVCENKETLPPMKMAAAISS